MIREAILKKRKEMKNNVLIIFMLMYNKIIN